MGDDSWLADTRQSCPSPKRRKCDFCRALPLVAQELVAYLNGEGDESKSDEHSKDGSEADSQDETSSIGVE